MTKSRRLFIASTALLAVLSALAWAGSHWRVFRVQHLHANDDTGSEGHQWIGLSSG